MDLGVETALGAEQDAGDVVGVPVGELQTQVLGLVAVFADADGEHMQARARGLAGFGGDWSARLTLARSARPKARGGLQFLEDERQSVGAQARMCWTGTVSAAASGPRLTCHCSTPCAPGEAASKPSGVQATQLARSSRTMSARSSRPSADEHGPRADSRANPFAGVSVLICQAQAVSATLPRCGTCGRRFLCRKRFRVEGCLVGWRRQRLPSRRPHWSRPSQPRHRLSAWSVGNHDGKDGAWVGECGA